MSGPLAIIVKTFLLPPICFLVMAGMGFAVQRRFPRLGRNLIVASFALLWLVSTPVLTILMLEVLGWPAPADVRPDNGAQAIVVLAGGVYPHAPEYGGADTVNSRTLDRVRYAAYLHRQTGLPILAAGGTPYGRSSPESELMKIVLEKEFATPVRWTETESRTTLENASGSARILREAGVSKVYLVTESIHMYRAVQAFAATSLEVIPAPTGFVAGYRMGYTDLIPSATAFTTSQLIAHEILGRAWYAIRSRMK